MTSTFTFIQHMFIWGSKGDTGNLGSIPGQEDPLEKEMATHSSILAWRIPRTEEASELVYRGSKESDTT